MTIPYREWRQFIHAGFYYSSTGGYDDTRPNWLAQRFDYAVCGWRRTNATPNVFTGWRGIARPVNDFESDPVNLNVVFDYQSLIWANLGTRTAAGVTHVHFEGGEGLYYPATPNTWDTELATGVFYDGVNYWCGIGSSTILNVNDYSCWTPFEQWDQPYSTMTFHGYGCRYKAGLGPDVWMRRWGYEHNGMALYVINPAGAPAAGEEITFNLKAQVYRLYYLNPVVNSLSRYSMPASGGVEVKLYGVGLSCDAAELEDTTYNLFNSHPPGGWNSEVYHIQFIGQQGQGTYLFHGHIPNSDFTINSNLEITIPAAKMPAMLEGAYEIYLSKDKAGFGGGYPGCGPAYAYAGDWRAAASGKLSRGIRIIFMVGEAGPGKKKPILYSKWKFKGYLGSIFRYYSPIDVIAPSVFYDGRIMTASSLTRAVSSREGLYTQSDMDFTLANHDLEFSRLLSAYFLKNQVVEIYYGWADQPEAWKTMAARLIVNDYSRAGSEFRARLRDVTTKYFKRKVPLYRCTAAEYPNIYKNAVNKPMPEVVGRAVLATAGQGGAIEAVLVDTAGRRYLASRGSLHAVLTVYKDGVALNPVLWAITYADGGRTYITIDASAYDADSKITFDAEGYMYAEWDSANGYVQNPAYVLAFYLLLLMEIPEEFFDFDSFDALASLFEDEGEEESGFLVLQNEVDGETPLGELLFTMGALSGFSIAGAFHVERKTLSVLATSLFIFSQIDTKEFPETTYNLDRAINRIRYRWAHYPGQDIWDGGEEASRASSVTDFEEELESPEFVDFPWTTSAAWAAKRAEEELLKNGYGQPEITFELAFPWIDYLDILTNFRLQDPFGVSLTGAGEIGRYCYVSSITVDFDQMKLGITAADLSWILRQYLILGDEAALAANWSAATDEMRIFAYLANEITGRFADGEPGKKLCSENLT